MHKDWRVQVPAWMLNRCIWICFRRLNTDALPFRHFEVEGFSFSRFDHRNILFGFTRLISDISANTLYIYNKTQPHMQLKEMINNHTYSDTLLNPCRDRGWIKKHCLVSALTRLASIDSSRVVYKGSQKCNHAMFIYHWLWASQFIGLHKSLEETHTYSIYLLYVVGRYDGFIVPWSLSRWGGFFFLPS
jgi:hypothetical protein